MIRVNKAVGEMTAALFPVELYLQKGWITLPNVFQILSVKTISSNTVTGVITHTFTRLVFQRGTVTISWSVKVRTPPDISKSILADRRYLTCGGRWKRIDWKNHCPVYQERMTGLDLLEKSTGSTKGAGVLGSWTWQIGHRKSEGVQLLLMQYQWTLDTLCPLSPDV